MDTNRKVKLSICVPIHQMSDGKYFLERCLDSIIEQSFQDYEVVVTDNSDNDELYRLCLHYGFPLTYSKNPRMGMAQNSNEAIKLAKGEIIKILYMDDLLAHKHALKEIVDAMNKDKRYWLATACEHTHGKDRFSKHIPKYVDDIHTGNNKIGSPSVIAFRNKEPLLFDEEMTWLLDCDLYKRLYDKHGVPIIINHTGVIIGVGEHQVTNILTQEDKNWEENYMQKKYAI